MAGKLEEFNTNIQSPKISMELAVEFRFCVFQAGFNQEKKKKKPHLSSVSKKIKTFTAATVIKMYKN